LYCRDHQYDANLRLARELDGLLKQKGLEIDGTDLMKKDGKKTTSKVFTAFVGSMQPADVTAGLDVAAELKKRLDAFEKVYENKIFAKAKCDACMSNRGCRRSRSKRKIERTLTPKLRSELGRPYISMRPDVFFDADGKDLFVKLRLKLQLDSSQRAAPKTRSVTRSAQKKSAENAEGAERLRRIESPRRTPTPDAQLTRRRSARLSAPGTPSAPGLAQPPKGRLLPLTSGSGFKFGFGFV
jgi:hypothetical protein